MTKQYVIDLAERIAATAAEAGIALALTEIADLHTWWVAPLTVALAAAKGWVAKYVGNKRSASLAKTV